MPTPTVTYSLSQISPTTGARIGTWMTALEYSVSETERAEREWAEKLIRYQAEEPNAQGVEIRRSAIFSKPTDEEHWARITATQAKIDAEIARTQIWDA